MPCLQTSIVSLGSIQLSSCRMESNLTMQSSHLSARPEKPTQKPKSAIASTLSTVAEIPPMTVVSVTPAKGASEWVMGKNLAMSKKALMHELRPKYLRYNIWDSGSVAGARLSSAWLSFCSLAIIGGLERSQATGLAAPI